jgi:protein-disulfide isomerase
LDSGQYKSAVDQDMKDGGKVGVNGTPSFFVENVAVSSPSFAALKKAIDAALAKKGKN